MLLSEKEEDPLPGITKAPDALPQGEFLGSPRSHDDTNILARSCSVDSGNSSFQFQ